MCGLAVIGSVLTFNGTSANMKGYHVQSRATGSELQVFGGNQLVGMLVRGSADRLLLCFVRMEMFCLNSVEVEGIGQVGGQV
jgi:hypothetical protein